VPTPDALPEPSPEPGREPLDVPGQPPRPPLGRRPLLERIGLAFVAVLLAALFAGVGIAAWLGGEPFLAAMGAIGCLMTAWAGGNTLLRG
jgi:hypothetical protein